MSIPRNHHFISQVHIKKFFNQKNEIYLYSKSTKSIFQKKSSEKIFSERDLNTKYQNGSNDYSSIEEQLNKYFENDFEFHFNIVKNITIDYVLDIQAQTSMLFLARYGAIANFRTPTHKSSLEETFFNSLKPAMDNATESLKKSFYDFFNNRGDSKFLAGTDYLYLANEIISKMGKIYFIIEMPKSEDDFFILPDFGASTQRKKINTYFNPDIEEIAYIGLPLSSKIYIHFYSEKHPEQINMSGIKLLNSDEVLYFNKLNFQFANEKIACESKSYLERLIKKNYLLTNYFC